MMPMSNLHGLAKQVGDDWVGGAYYDAAEKDMGHQWQTVIWPVIKGADFTETLDLAAGHGRNTARLLDHAARVTAVDINQENIDFLSNRFRGNGKVVVLKNSGSDIRDVAGSSISFLYSFDAMVHFDSDVVNAYIREFRRVMKPGARGFCHYSNNYHNPTGSYRSHPGWRNFMSRQLFEHWLTKLEFRVVKSYYLKGVLDVMEKEDGECDAMTLFELPADATPLGDFLGRRGNPAEGSDQQSDEIYDEVGRLRGVVEQVSAENDSLKANFKWLQNENVVANQRCRDLEDVNEELKKGLAGSRRHAENLEKGHKELKEGLSSLGEYRDYLLKENEHLRRRLEDAQRSN